MALKASLATKSQRKALPAPLHTRRLKTSFEHSEIQYVGQDYKWGFQIADSEQRCQWFKLDLDPSQARDSSGLAARYPDPMPSPPSYNMAPEKLVTDYLTALRKHAEQVLRYKLPQGALTDTPIEYVVRYLSLRAELKTYLANTH